MRARMMSMMRTRSIVLAGGVALAILWFGEPLSKAQQTKSSAVRRTADGKPDFNGIWQAMNTAAWDIQDHSGALGVPPGLGVVEGGEIPYQPAALVKKKENFTKRATADPDRGKLLPARRAARHLHAASLRDRTGISSDRFPLRIRACDPKCSHGRKPASRRAAGCMDGRFARALGRRRAGRRREESQRPDVVRSRREFSQRCAAPGRAVHADESRSYSVRGHRGRSQGVHSSLEDRACRSIAGWKRTPGCWSTSACFISRKRDSSLRRLRNRRCERATGAVDRDRVYRFGAGPHCRVHCSSHA